jgi:1-acyl-sn-glycerol-3-phosphate acyltransferase
MKSDETGVSSVRKAMKEEINQEPVKLVQILASIYFWVTLFLIPGFFFPFLVLIWLLTFLFDKRLVFLHRCTCLLSDTTLGANPYWKATIYGKEKIQKDQTYIIVSNHQSGADILVLFKTHAVFKWVSKKSLFYLPFIGWNMMMNGYIPIERTRGRSKLRMMDKAVEAVKKGNSLMIFPEGTRSRDGNLQPFKSGAFRLALETGASILPIAIKGTFHAIKKGSPVINKNYNLRAVILDPLPYATFSGKSPNEIAQMVHDLVQAELIRP